MTTANETFDFIVTGAGSAGCAVAGRLSESGKYRVLLLEAGGPDRNPWIHIPLGYTKTYTNPRLNWMFETEPEAQLNGRTLYQPRGKVLGGTSSINGMVSIGGSAAAKAGIGTACCRSSRRPRTRNAAPTSTTGPAGRSTSQTRCAARWATRWSRPRSRPASRP